MDLKVLINKIVKNRLKLKILGERSHITSADEERGVGKFLRLLTGEGSWPKLLEFCPTFRIQSQFFKVCTYLSIYDIGVEASLLDASRKTCVPLVMRARKWEAGLPIYVSRMIRTNNFTGNHFFFAFHATLIIISPKYSVAISKGMPPDKC